MTIRHGRELLAMPGPTNIPDAVLSAMHRPAIDIYAGELVGMTDHCLDGLRTVFATEGNPYIYAANGHGAWEAALSNVLSRGDEVVVLESGRFAINWGRMAEHMGLTIHTLSGDFSSAVDPAKVTDWLRENATPKLKAVLVVQVDTASGVVNDIPAIRSAMDSAGTDALLMVDTIASLGTMPFEMDGWGVDVSVSGSQKGLMCPPGLSFCAANPRAMAAHQTADLRTGYWDWTDRMGAEHYMKYCGTPPEHLIFALDKAIEILLDEGLPAAFTRHRLLANCVRAAVGVWAEGGALDFNVTKPEQRADSVTTVVMKGDHDPRAILDFCAQTCGVTLGLGIGGLGGFRIAHMGHVNAPMTLGALSTVELALAQLKIPHGSGGVESAIKSLDADLRELK